MTLAVLARSLRRARASRPIPARPPTVFTTRSVTSEFPTARTYWAVSRSRLAPATTPTAFHHGHDGEEVTLVVSGAYHDGRARYGTGDISVMTPDDDHHPIAEPGPVCYALGVSFGRPQFHGLAGMIQKAVTRH